MGRPERFGDAEQCDQLAGHWTPALHCLQFPSRRRQRARTERSESRILLHGHAQRRYLIEFIVRLFFSAVTDMSLVKSPIKVHVVRVGVVFDLRSNPLVKYERVFFCIIRCTVGGVYLSRLEIQSV